MSKKWIATAGIAALVVVAIAAGLTLTSCKKSSTGMGTGVQSGTSSSTSASGTATTAGGSGANGGKTAGSTTSGPQGTSGSTTSGGSSGSNSGGGSAPIKSGPNSGKVTNTTLSPFPPMNEPKVAAQALKAPAAAGATLVPLTAAPAPTISGIQLGNVPLGSQYQITMRPIGFGPSLQLGSRMVVLVDTIKPVGKAPVIPALASANVLVLVDTNHGGAVYKGGSYTAVLTMGSDGKKVLPVMSAVKASK